MHNGTQNIDTFQAEKNKNLHQKLYHHFILYYMKYTSLSSFIVLLLFVACNSGSRKVEVSESDLKNALDQNDFFTLSEKLTAIAQDIDKGKQLYYSAFVEKAFGHHAASNTAIDELLGQYSHQFPDSIIVELLDLKAANLLYQYQYKEVTDVYNTIITKHRASLDSNNVEQYQNLIALTSGLKDVPKQSVSLQDAARIPCSRNAFNHLMIPVGPVNGQDEFIFDTGANFSTISRSQAEKMKLKIIESKIAVGSSTLTEVQSAVAVADSLYIGEVLFQNVVFLLLPDEQLSFPDINYVIHGIIGFPVIFQMGHLTFEREGWLTIQRQNKKDGKANMFLDGLNPVVQVFAERDTLLFTFDTGAVNSELSFKYYKTHQTRLDSLGTTTNARGGVGGMVEVKEITLPTLNYRIGAQTGVLSNVPISLEEYAFNKYFDGNLGQDVFSKYDRFVIDFVNMEVSLR